MADRPINSFNTLQEVEAEINRLEEEVGETRLLHENLLFVQGLARDILQHLQNCRRAPTAYQNQQSQTSQGQGCNQSGRARPCACSPNQNQPCRQVCVSPQQYQHLMQYGPSSGSGPASSSNTGSRTNTTATSGSNSNSSGSTVAEFRVNMPIDPSTSGSCAHPNSTYANSPNSVPQSQFSQPSSMQFRYQQQPLHYIGPVGYANNTI